MLKLENFEKANFVHFVRCPLDENICLLTKAVAFLTRFNKVQIFKIVKLSEQKVRSK